MRRLMLLALLSSGAAAAPAAAADAYGKWSHNAVKKRYECTYTYDAKAGGTATQTVVAYTPADKDRYGWAYFYNADGKPWGRCAVPGNPKYDDKAMYWQHLAPKKDGYEDYPTAGYCPAPADGKRPVSPLPDPPK